MIQKLRRKFILTNLLLVSLVLLIVFAALVGSNYRKLTFQTEGALRGALNWRSDAPPPLLEIGGTKPGHGADGEGRGSMVPVFVVTLDETGAISDVNGGNSVAVTDALLEQLTAYLQGGGGSGEVPGLGLRCLREIGRDGAERAAFADLSWERDSLQTLVLSSLLVGVLALVGLFLISLALAKLALHPAEVAWEQQRRFVADASHELKTPLTVILTNSGILLSHKDETVGHEAKWVEYIQLEAQRMRGLVEDLLFLAKNDGLRESAAAPKAEDFSQLCWSALLPFESVAFEAGVTLLSTITPELTVVGRGDQLRRLIAILLDNAVKYAGDHGSVAVELNRGEKNTVRLSVTNSGCAIAPEHIERIFQRFYRADDSRARATGGYGLGLSIAKSIAEGHRGSLTVKSTEGAGTTFTFQMAAAQSLPQSLKRGDKA